MAAADDTDRDPLPPRENAELVGQEGAERVLLGAWNAGRLPHAWLLAGPRGVGKATLAYRFARFALAGGGDGGLFGPPETLALGPEHPVFRRVASGGHADLMTLEPGFTEEEMRKDAADRQRRRETIGVDEVRKAGEFLRLTPAEGGWRVIVVDSADQMTPSAANALLKSLEEPSAKALILLVSHAPGRLMPTIRSRCCRLALRPLADEAVAALIARHLPELGEADRAALTGLAEGSIGRALALAEAGGIELSRTLDRLLDGLPSVDGQALHGFADQFGRPGTEARWRTACGLLTWRLGRAIGRAARGAADDPLAGRLAALAPLDRWIEVWDKVTRLVAQADGINLDRKQAVLSAFFALERAAGAGARSR